MRTRRHATIQELRHAVDALPVKTRVAMLEGIRDNEIILGAYASGEGGICPMLAAHRRGGRTNAEGFAQTWDRFGAVHGRRARHATERELLILTTHLEMSLLADSAPVPARATGAVRPGEPDRTAELGNAPGWSWMRAFRRYDDYERALARLEAQPAVPERRAAIVSP
jgi:hypothetical protein